ncbi:hypothetical protein TNCV_1011621 [Trichonephila clavipes]|uniref:Uncharacterized protein n=1 Tax=Trichonephila clavipes TaxID=2585209 RepID=A0A8X7BAR9_TRICX|nr:hypothetical protein TNCV_1011621 [Trichonephila clavipes]
MACVFSRHGSNRARLERSRKTSCWTPTPTPQTFQDLERALLEEWYRIPQLVINSLIDSMPQRIMETIPPEDFRRERYRLAYSTDMCKETNSEEHPGEKDDKTSLYY